MNIILLTSSTNISGGARQALYLADGLLERGHAVSFFVPPKAALPDIAPDRPFWRSMRAARLDRGEIEAAMPARGAPCVVHAFHNAAVKAVAWWGLFWKKRAAVAAHRGVIFRPGNPLPYWSPGIDRFLVNSRACGRVLRGIGVSERRINYVPNAVPDSRLLARVPRRDLRASLGVRDDDLLFLCIGGNKPYKGTDVLLRAFAEAFPAQSGRGPYLALVGQMPDIWEQPARELGILDRLRFAGRTEDVGSWLAASDVFVLPSRSESMPNTLLEALRAGLPSVGTEVGAVPDILSGSDSPCGLLVPPADAPALAAAMRRMALEPELRAAFAAGARSRGRSYEPKQRLDLVEGIYRDILQHKGLLS